MQEILGMLLALVLCYDYRKNRDLGNDTKFPVMRGCKYFWHALSGYTTGLIAALAAGILTRLPQPALLYLVLISIMHFKLNNLQVKNIFLWHLHCALVFLSYKLESFHVIVYFENMNELA